MEYEKLVLNGEVELVVVEFFDLLSTSTSSHCWLGPPCLFHAMIWVPCSFLPPGLSKQRLWFLSLICWPSTTQVWLPLPWRGHMISLAPLFTPPWTSMTSSERLDLMVPSGCMVKICAGVPLKGQRCRLFPWCVLPPTTSSYMPLFRCLIYTLRPSFELVKSLASVLLFSWHVNLEYLTSVPAGRESNIKIICPPSPCVFLPVHST